MSTSLLYHGFGVRGYQYLRADYEGGAVCLTVAPKRVRCPRCATRAVVTHGGRWRILRTLPIGRRPVFLKVRIVRVYCKQCRTFSEMHPPFADPRRTYTHALARFVVDLCRISTIQGAAKIAGVSWDVAKDIEKRRLESAYKCVPLKGVRYLAVDEISIRRGHTYMTLVADLETGRVLHVAEGKGREALKPFLLRLKRSRAKVKAIAMDMSGAYASAVREMLPNVPVVYDRFHVVKLMNACLEELRRKHVRDTEKAQRKLVKGVRFLVLMSADTLERYEKRRPGSKERLRQALAVNEPLCKGYYLKEKLRLLWEEPNRTAGDRLLRDWCAEAEASGIPVLKRLARTLTVHREGILAYFDHGRVTSGPLEGINNKIKTLKRAAYGFRDSEFFKLKILALHETRYCLVG